MIRFQYGPVQTIVTGDDVEVQIVNQILSIREEKTDTFTNLLEQAQAGTRYFLSGLLDRVLNSLQKLNDPNLKWEVTGRPEQCDIADCVVPDDILDGITLYDYQGPAITKAIWNRRGIVKIPTGGGKSPAPETPILHYDGTITRADEVQVGDLLMGPDSTPRRVTSVNFGHGPMVKIIPVKGDPWYCNDVHILTLVHTETGDIVDIPVDEYEQKSKTFKHCHKLFQPEVIDFGVEQGRFGIPPYFLGVWFGDGRRSLQTVEISKPDPEIEQACREVAKLYNLDVVVDGEQYGRCKTYRLVGRGRKNRLLCDLRALVGDAERIPRPYLTASREDRRALLAGLLDTDGYLHHGYFEIVQRREGVAKDIAFLARSLGFRVTVREKMVELESGCTEVYQRINILGDATSLPLRIPRKIPKPRRQTKNPLRTGFKIEHVDDGVYRGITLEGDGRFLLGDFTVTHNTEISGAIAKHLEETQGISTLMIVPGINSMHQVHSRWLRRGVSSVGRLGDHKKETSETHMVAVINSLANGIKRRDPKLMKWLDQQCGCVLFMECQHVPARTWESIGNCLDVPYRIGLSATPFENPGDAKTARDLCLVGVTGDIVSQCADFVVMNQGHMATPKVHFVKVGGTRQLGNESDWNVLRRDGIAKNKVRNDLIRDLAIDLAEDGNRVLILTTEIAHGKLLARGVSKKIENTYMFQGGSKLTEFRKGLEWDQSRVPITKVANMLSELESYVLVGSPALDEDADFPDANVLIVGGAGRSFKKVVQRAGRILRAKPDTNICHIIDFDDRCAYRLRAQSRHRRKLYLDRYRGAKLFSITDHPGSGGVVGAIRNDNNNEGGVRGDEAVSV